MALYGLALFSTSMNISQLVKTSVAQDSWRKEQLSLRQRGLSLKKEKTYTRTSSILSIVLYSYLDVPQKNNWCSCCSIKRVTQLHLPQPTNRCRPSHCTYSPEGRDESKQSLNSKFVLPKILFRKLTWTHSHAQEGGVGREGAQQRQQKRRTTILKPAWMKTDALRWKTRK